MKLPLLGLLSRVSVRTRIIALAAIPVAGFAINGIAYTVGEGEVERAFQTADRAADLADVSREFRTALIEIRVHTRDFASHPGPDVVKAFDATHESSLRLLDTIDAAVDECARPKLAGLKA